MAPVNARLPPVLLQPLDRVPHHRRGADHVEPDVRVIRLDQARQAMPEQRGEMRASGDDVEDNVNR
jgi:hypothetical protein